MDIIQDYDESQLGVAHTLIVDGKYYTNTQFKGYITPCVRAFHESLKLRDARGGRQLHASSHVMMIGFQKDLIITKITLIGAGINIFLNIILIPKIGVTGAIYSKTIAFTFILLSKYLMQKKLVEL